MIISSISLDHLQNQEYTYKHGIQNLRIEEDFNIFTLDRSIVFTLLRLIIIFISVFSIISNVMCKLTDY